MIRPTRDEAALYWVTLVSSYSSSGISWHCIELYRPAAQVGRSIDDCTARSGGGAQISCGEGLSTYIKQMTNDRPKYRWSVENSTERPRTLRMIGQLSYAVRELS